MRALFLNLQQALTLVFVETKKGADALEHWLCLNNFPATTIQGDRTQQVCLFYAYVFLYCFFCKSVQCSMKALDNAWV
jgi:hypothetical protein